MPPFSNFSIYRLPFGRNNKDLRVKAHEESSLICLKVKNQQKTNMIIHTYVNILTIPLRKGDFVPVPAENTTLHLPLTCKVSTGLKV